MRKLGACGGGELHRRTRIESEFAHTGARAIIVNGEDQQGRGHELRNGIPTLLSKSHRKPPAEPGTPIVHIHSLVAGLICQETRSVKLPILL